MVADFFLKQESKGPEAIKIKTCHIAGGSVPD